MQRKALAGAKMQAVQKCAYMYEQWIQLLLSCSVVYRRLMKNCKQLTSENSLCRSDGLFRSPQRSPYVLPWGGDGNLNTKFGT